MVRFPRDCDRCLELFQPGTRYQKYCSKCKVEIRKESHVKSSITFMHRMALVRSVEREEEVVTWQTKTQG